MANKFAEDIRRIARGTRFKGQLGEYSPRDPIDETQIALITDPMALGGGYGNGGLNNETPTSEAPNSETEQNENEGDQNPPQDPNNPNSFYKGGAGEGDDSAAGEGSFDAEDIIDGNAGPQTTIPGTSGGVNEISGMIDCESETPFNLQLDGNFPVPEGWDDAETPPVDPEYIEGKYWRITTTSWASCGDVAAPGGRRALKSDAVSSAQQASQLLANCLNDSASNPYSVQTDASDPESVSVTVENINNTVGIVVISIDDCEASDFDTSYCPLTPPSATEWPEDGIFELANKDGKLVTNDFDADAPAQYSSSGKDFCFGEDRTGKILVTADGGTMIYETNAEGAPTGTIRVYGRDGTAQAFGDATDAFISQYLPK